MPTATISPQGSAIRIVRVNNAAGQARIRPGQTLTEAKAVVPDLITYDDDPAADRRQLETLAIWAQCFSPTVHLEGDDTLFLDVSGCERLFQGEQNLLELCRRDLMAQGFACRLAIADTPGAAWAIARAHPESAVVAEAEMSVVYLSPLPVWALRVDQRTAHDLHRVGIDNIGSLLHLPRSSLTSRFGGELLDRIDQALGDLPELLTAYRPQPIMSRRLEFGGTTDRIEVLAEAVRQAVTSFCEELNRQTAGVRQLFVTFRCPDVRVDGKTQDRSVTLEVSLSQGTRSARHLLSLLRVRLDELALPAPTDSVVVWARQTEHLDDEQIDLFDSGVQDARSLGDLLDRLAVRLGPSSVVRPQLISEHQPEYAFRYVPCNEAAKLCLKQNRDRKVSDSPWRGAAKGVAKVGKSRKVKINSDGAAKRPAAAGKLRDEGKSDEAFVEHRERSDEGAVDKGALSIVDCQLPIQAGNGSNSSFQLPNCQITKLPNRLSDGDQVHRPLRLLKQPLAIAATSVVPDGPPIAFQFQEVRHAIVAEIGPERIETGWWRGAHVQRDYYRVLSEQGRRFWIFRARNTGQWFLQGWFD